MIREITGMLVTAIASAKTSAEGDPVVGAADESVRAVPVEDQHQAPDEGEHAADDRDRRDRAALRLGQDRSQLRAGAVHQQDQPELVGHAQAGVGDVGVRERGLVPVGQQVTEQRRPEQQSTDDLPGHPRLAQSDRHPPQAVRRGQQQGQGEDQVREVTVGEAHRRTPTPRAVRRCSMWLPSRSDGAPSGDRRSPTVVDISHRDAKLLAEPYGLANRSTVVAPDCQSTLMSPGWSTRSSRRTCTPTPMKPPTNEPATPPSSTAAMRRSRRPGPRVLRPGSDSC